jgi:branched-subunit amino acid aminotransferase/4-amino-4-deoxychorismate lyase
MRVTFEAGTRESAVAVEPFEGYPPEWYERGAVAHLADDRGHPLGAAAGRKVWPYDRMADLREKARAEGAADLVHLDADGALLEGCGSNLFLARDCTILTPPTTRPILPGVTRAAVLAAAGRLGIPVEERDLFPADVENADEAFLTGSLMEVLPLRRLGHVDLAPGPIARRLLRELRG